MNSSRRVQSWHLILLSFVIHLVLILHADHIDSHPERYGGLKYTDVDWRVVNDGGRMIFEPSDDNKAEGWLASILWKHGLRIGSPYNRQTFRYTPLLPLLLYPAHLYPIYGKILLSIISLSIPVLLRFDPRILISNGKFNGNVVVKPAPFWPTHLIWTLTPFVLNITTRGSSEAIIVVLVVLVLTLLRIGSLPVSPKAQGLKEDTDVIDRSNEALWTVENRISMEDSAAITLALAISFKIYPIIYVPAIWRHLSGRYGLFGKSIWRFGFITALSLVVINGILWSIWGHPFLEHTYLYHLHRKDHRHNFSPYFYPIYLSLYDSSSSTLLSKVLRNPLTSFIPQTSLVLAAGWLLPAKSGLAFTLFIQTTIFVVFNKVCTSQYFMWFLALIPAIMAQIKMTTRQVVIPLLLWIGGQAVWLGMAYNLELLAKDFFLEVWAAGILLFAISVYIIGELMDSFV